MSWMSFLEKPRRCKPMMFSPASRARLPSAMPYGMRSFSKPRHAAEERAAADARELNDRRAAAKNHVITDRHMPAEHDVIGEHDVVADVAVVADVGIGEEGAIIADRGLKAAVRSARVHGHAFADHAVGADGERIGFAFVFQILRRMTDGGEGIDLCARADIGVACHGDVRDQFDMIAELDLGAHHAIGADLHAVAEFGAGFDDCRGMDGLVSHACSQML